MAGGSSSWTAFDAARFRSAIQFVMTMGSPPVAGDQVTFGWDPTVTAAGPKSGDGVPYDPSQSVTTTSHSTAKVPCAIEFIDAAGEPTPFGRVIPSKVRVWLLDVDYATVKTANYVLIAGDRYEREHEQPSYGLFDVGLHVLLFAAVNET